MSYVNLGNQIINFDYKEPLEAKEFNKLLRDILNPGIYAGGLVTVGGINSISIAPFTALLYVSTDKAVTAKTTTAVSMTVSSLTPIVYIQYVWEDVIENWLDFSTRAEGTAKASNEVTLGTVTFNLDGSVSGFSYESRMIPDTFLPENYSGHADKLMGINTEADDISYKDIYAMTTAGKSLVGINISTPDACIDAKSTALSSTITTINKWLQLYGSNGTTSDYLKIYDYRYGSGSTDATSEIRIEKTVDSSKKHYISFKGGLSGSNKLSIGYNNVELITISETGALVTPVGITATTGNITASSGNISASGTATGGTGVTATTGNITSTAGNFVDRTGGNIVPPGVIFSYASPTVPDGFFECDGSPISRITYATLFSVIGITHGQGNGTTTFNLPDYRGYFLRGYADGTSIDPDKASRTAMNTGGNTGDNVGSIQTHAMQTHGHTYYYDTPLLNTTPNNWGDAWPGTSASTFSNTTTVGAPASLDWWNIPSVSALETRPTNANVMYIIKY
jgi:microcystin-dependent protein